MKRTILFLIILLFFTGISGISGQSGERRLYLEAENRYQSGEYLFALNRYDEFLREYPLSQYVPDVHFRRGVIFHRLGRYQEALTQFERVERRYGGTRNAVYIPFWKGVSHYYLNNLSEAAAHIENFITTREEILRKEAFLYKGLIFRDQGKPAEALGAVQTAASLTADLQTDVYTATLLASLMVKAREFVPLFTLLRNLDLDRIPERWRNRLLLYHAEGLYQMGSPEAEELYLNLRSEEFEISSIAYQRLYTIYQRQNEEEKRDKIFEEAQTVFAGKPALLNGFLLRAGIESFKEEKYDLSASYLSRIMRTVPFESLDGLVPLYRAHLYALEGETERAVDILKRYLAVSRDQEEAILFSLAKLYTETEAWNDTEQILKRFLREYPSSGSYAEASYLHAYAVYKNGNYREAAVLVDDLFDQARGGAVTDKLLRLKSRIHLSSERNREAVTVLREYIPLRPDDLEARIDLMRARFSLREYRQVIETGERVFSDFPDLVSRDMKEASTIRYMKGLSFLSLREYQRSKQAFEEVVRSDLDTSGLGEIRPYAYFYSGWASYRLADYPEAIRNFELLVTGYPDHSFTSEGTYLAGWAAFAAGNYGTAERYFLKYANEAPQRDSDKGVFMYGKALLAGGKPEDASAIFQRLYLDSPSSAFADDAMYEYGLILNSMGRPESAVDVFSALASRYATSPLAEESLYKRGEILFNQAEYRRSRDAFYEHRTRFPGGGLIDLSLFWGGMAAYMSGEKYGAVLLWERIIEEYPQSSFHAEALRRSAEVFGEAGDFRKALTYYTNFLTRYPEQAKSADAEKRIQTLRLIIAGRGEREAELQVIIDRDGASTSSGRDALIEIARINMYRHDTERGNVEGLLRQVIDSRQSDPNSTARANYFLGEYHYRQGDLSKAAEHFIEAATRDPDDKDLMAISLFRAAEMAMMGGDRETATRLVRRIEAGFPASEWAVEGRALLGGRR